MILLLIVIIPQIIHKDNIITFLLIAVMPQNIYKEFTIFLLFSVNAFQESCVGIVENMSTLGICLIYN